MRSTPSEQNCYFCKVTSGQADPFIFENRSFVGIFDTNPVNPGHVLVIPRRHVVSIFDLNKAEQSDYFDALHGVKSVIEATNFAEVYASMMARDDLSDRPMDHIEAVLELPFLAKNRMPIPLATTTAEKQDGALTIYMSFSCLAIREMSKTQEVAFGTLLQKERIIRGGDLAISVQSHTS